MAGLPRHRNVFEDESMLATANKFINVGEVVTRESGYLRGHGIRQQYNNQLDCNELIACVAGFLQQTNKFLVIKPMRSRYKPQVGHVIVGRISNVRDKTWDVDIGAHLHASLALSAIHLPGGVHRRRTESDALQMRKFFREGDLISAEIQSFKSQGNINLHTRTLKYGKLLNGIFIKCDQSLIQASNQHFINFDKLNSNLKKNSNKGNKNNKNSKNDKSKNENNKNELKIGVEMILGNNGYIWLTNHKKDSEIKKMYKFKEQYDDYTPFLEDITMQVRLNMARIRNCILALNKMFLPINGQTILDVFHTSINCSISVKDIVDSQETIQKCTENVLFKVQQSL